MESDQKTKVCKKCGRELPLTMFNKGKSSDGKDSYCKQCRNEVSRAYYKLKKLRQGNPLNPDLEGFTPQQLITELRARGYEGTLTYTEVKVHHIKL